MWGGDNGVETVHYPSAWSLLSFCVRMWSAGNLPFLLWCLQEKHRTMQVCDQDPASTITSAHPGTISLQIRVQKQLYLVWWESTN